MSENIRIESGDNHAKIKLCGLMTKEDIETANKLKPDFIGFVFWEKSKRNVTRQKAKELKSLLDKDIKAVGVFVDEEPSKIIELFEEKIINIAQLHGHESEEYITELKNKGIPVIKAFKVTDREILKIAEKSSADLILLDAGMGCGKSFDWSILQNEGQTRPYLLAGGLDPDNVQKAIKQLHPYGVDVSSGIETEGRKDMGKMKIFVEKVKNSTRFS